MHPNGKFGYKHPLANSFFGISCRTLAAAVKWTQQGIKYRGECSMTIDKSLKVSKGIVRARNVLTRAERIERLVTQDRWSEADGPFGLPKVRVYKVVLKKKKKAKGEEETAGDKGAKGAKAAPKAAAAAKTAAPKKK